MPGSYVFRWRETRDDGSHRSWSIRGIDSSGKYYGEVQVDSPGNRHQVAVQGVLADADYRELSGLAVSLAAADVEEVLPDDSCPQYGLLGFGKPSALELIMRYPAPETATKANIAFRRIVEILRPYLRPRKDS